MNGRTNRSHRAEHYSNLWSLRISSDCYVEPCHCTELTTLSWKCEGSNSMDGCKGIARNCKFSSARPFIQLKGEGTTPKFWSSRRLKVTVLDASYWRQVLATFIGEKRPTFRTSVSASLRSRSPCFRPPPTPMPKMPCLCNRERGSHWGAQSTQPWTRCKVIAVAECNESVDR